jgi:hypothetical protein
MKLQAQKGPILQKGRFSVTSDDVNLEDPHHASGRRIPVPQTGSLHKSASVGDWSSERRQPVCFPPLASWGVFFLPAFARFCFWVSHKLSELFMCGCSKKLQLMSCSCDSVMQFISAM